LQRAFVRAILLGMSHRVLSLAVIFAALAFAQEPARVTRAKQFLDLLAQGDFAAAQAMLNAELAPKLPSQTLEQIWKSVQQQVGAYRRSGSTREEPSEKADVVFITCEFEKMALDARIPVDRDGKIAGLNFNQHSDYVAPGYVNSTAFREQDVIVGSGEWAVHGTLATPSGQGPFPALVLLQGSGNTDRDSALGPNKIFRDIAWGVASHGVAVLRYNKRPNEHPEAFSKLSSFTVKEEVTDDALSACVLLRATPGIDPKRIFVLGHSLGGTVAPRIAAAHPSIAGLVLLGATQFMLLDLIVPQAIHNFTLHGPMTDAQQKVVEQLRQQVARTKDPTLTATAPRSEMPLGAPASYWLSLRDYHPAQVAATLKLPMLVLQAERDYQVTMEDFDGWKKALAGRKNVTFRSYPKLNHMFLEGEGVSSDEEYLKPGHVPRVVVEDIANWVKEH
jgi:dienelactone hydrolase